MKLAVLASAFVGTAAAFCPNKTFARTPVVTNMASRVSASSSLLTTLRGGAIAAATPKEKPASFLTGKLSLALTTLIARSGSAFRRVDAAFHLSDVVFILCLSFLPEIVLRFVNNSIVNKMIRRNKPLDFDDTLVTSKLSTVLCQIGQLALLVYTGELFMVFLSGLGVPHLQDKPKLLATLVYGMWAAKMVSNIKSRLMDQAFTRYANRARLAPRKALYNRVLDAAIYLVCLLIFFDLNSMDVGVALKSLMTLGGVSSIVVGLALKEPVTEIIQGTSVLVSDKFRQGDVIRLGDGTTGQVQDIKWTDISIRGSDNSFVRIPNSQLAKSRIVNMSRMPHSQVSQQVRLPNRGVSKIEQLLQDIKSEIRASCPKLVDDGSQPFRVHWTDLEKDAVVISIESHFRIARLSEKYWDNRQNVLMAISRAVDKYN